MPHVSNGSPQQTRAEIHTVVFTETTDYHTAGADMQDKLVRFNCLMVGEGSHLNNGDFLESCRKFLTVHSIVKHSQHFYTWCCL